MTVRQVCARLLHPPLLVLLPADGGHKLRLFLPRVYHLPVSTLFLLFNNHCCHQPCKIPPNWQPHSVRCKVLNFVSAMMSILGLQTAMIAAFSADGPAFRRMMNAITGGFVWGIVIVIAVYMLLHSAKERVNFLEQIRK